MFKRIVFNQFYDLQKNGKDPLKARLNVLLIVSILIGLFVLLFFLLANSWFSFPRLRTYGLSGKSIGKMIGLLFLGVVFALFYLGLGKNLIARYWAEFEQLDEQTQEAESKKGARYFLIPFFILLMSILILGISSLF